jgi:hypothetical protein
VRLAAFATLVAVLHASCAAPSAWNRIDFTRTWRPFQFGGDGIHRVEPERLVLEPGAPLTGGAFDVALPKDRYEIEFEAQRLSGIDFFCGLTFPTVRGELTLVLGGWGGTVCGLSSLDGSDASDNETRTLRHFPDAREVAVRIHVDGEEVCVFLDGAPFLSAHLAGKQVTVRAEVEPCRPFGFCCYLVTAKLSHLRWRRL